MEKETSRNKLGLIETVSRGGGVERGGVEKMAISMESLKKSVDVSVAQVAGIRYFIFFVSLYEVIQVTRSFNKLRH